MLRIQEVMIEITRTCNMACSHCIRGKSQKGVITKETIRNFFLNLEVEKIGNLVFTGGEPSLNPEVIQYTIDVLNEQGILFDGFYIATNGTQHSKTNEFLMMLIKLYSEAQDVGMCSVLVSRDDYHLEAGIEGADDMYESLRFVRIEDGNSDYELFNDGFAFDNGNPLAIKTYDLGNVSISIEESNGFYEIENEEPLYLSVNGDIGIGCNFSYETFDSELIIANIDNIDSTLSFISELNNFADNSDLNLELDLESEEVA